MSGIKKRGFASLSKDRLSQITSAAGKRAHALGRAHKWNSEQARRAGQTGAISRRASKSEKS